MSVNTSTTNFLLNSTQQITTTVQRSIILSTVRSQSQELNQFTDIFGNYTYPNSTTSTERYKNGLPKWQVILIAALSSVGVLGILALILIACACSKKKQPPSVPPSANSERNEKKTAGCCPCWGKSKKTENGAASFAGNNNNNNGEHPIPMERNFKKINLAPLPPIAPKYNNGNAAEAASNNINGEGGEEQFYRTPHKRLAPLFQDNAKSINPVRNAYTLHGGQQNFSLKGVPMIQVPDDKRRPLPTPPNLE